MISGPAISMTKNVNIYISTLHTPSVLNILTKVREYRTMVATDCINYGSISHEVTGG